MNLEAQRKLKFDRRLIGRRGAATEAELAAELSNLPDAADKAARPQPEEAGAKPAASSEARP